MCIAHCTILFLFNNDGENIIINLPKTEQEATALWDSLKPLTDNKETKKKLRDVTIQLNGDVVYQFENCDDTILSSNFDLIDNGSFTELRDAGLAAIILRQQEEIKQLQIELIVLKQFLKVN